MKFYVGFLCLASAASLVACGGSQVTALSGHSDSKPQGVLKLEDQTELESALASQGTLGPLSDYDLKTDPALLESGLPFLDSAGPEHSFSTFRHPRSGHQKVKIKNQEEVAYVSHSNLVFRALRQIPPKSAINGVKKFLLKFTGLRVFVPKDGKPSAEQSICILDGKSCLGEFPKISKDAASAGANPKFWTGATVRGLDFLNQTELKEVSKTDEAGALYASEKGELEIDLLNAFELSEKTAIDFLFTHSELYSSPEAGFRKFRFSMGDRILADGGELEIEFDLNESMVPKDYQKRLPAPIHGAADMVNFESKRKNRSMKEDGVLLEGDYIRILDQNEVKAGEASRVASVLFARRDQIEEIHLVSLNAESSSEDLLKEVRSEFLKVGVSEQSLKSFTKIEEGAEPSVGVAVKLVAELEKNQDERKRSIQEILKEVLKENVDIPQ